MPLSYETPLRYRGYRIYPNPPAAREWRWRYEHEDFDPGPWEVGGPPMDERHGDARAIDEAVAEIDALIEEAA